MRDINQLHPRARELALKLQQKCAAQGITIAIGECFRTVGEQDALYAQGRTTGGSIVTTWKGSTYSSMHQWGVAFDFYLKMDVDGDGSVSDDAFNNATGLFERVGSIGQSIGLEWGGSWKSIKDRPHFQLPDWGSTATKLKNLYGTFDNFKKTWGTASNTNNQPSAPAVNNTPTNSNYGSGTITASSGVNVRSTPDSSNPSNKVGAIPNGKTVSIIKLNASNAGGLVWAQIVYGSITGYVAQKYINITKKPKEENVSSEPVYSKSSVDSAASKDPALAGTYKTTANLNLRIGAGTKKDIIITIPKGESVINYGFYTVNSGTQWLLVAYGKYTGFVSKDYLKK